MGQITWEDVIKREDIVGGDLETHEDGGVYRGPIELIELKDGYVRFRSPWVAKFDEKTGTWKNWHITSCGITAECKPNDIGNGRIQFTMIMLGFGIIFPKGGSKLDPARVEGLTLCA